MIQRDPDLDLVVDSKTPAVLLVRLKDDGDSVQINITEEIVDLDFTFNQREGAIARISLRANVIMDAPLDGIELTAGGFGGVTREEINEAMTGGDFTMSPIDRIMMLLQARGLAGVPSADGPPS